MARLFDWEKENLSGGDRLRMREQEKRNFSQDLANEAHQRAMERRANFIESNPNAVSPWERSAVLGRRQQLQDEGRLRAHEMDMLKQRGENDKAVAYEKRLGLENQGIAVGKLRYGYTDERGNRVEGGDVLTERERQKGALNAAKLKYGYTDERGNRVEGSDVLTERERNNGILNAEKARQEGTLKVEQTKGKNALAVAREQGDTSLELADKQKETAATQARIEALRQAGNDKRVQDKLINEQVIALQKLPENKGQPPAALRKKALEILGIGGVPGGGLSDYEVR